MELRNKIVPSAQNLVLSATRNQDCKKYMNYMVNHIARNSIRINLKIIQYLLEKIKKLSKKLKIK